MNKMKEFEHMLYQGIMNPCGVRVESNELDQGLKCSSSFTEWNFNSSSEADINWKDIKDALTYAEPLALVTRKYRDFTGSDTYIVLNKQLMDKARAVGMDADAPSVLGAVAKRAYQTDVPFSAWIAWAKAVKTAKWPDPLKSKINVVLPNV